MTITTKIRIFYLNEEINDNNPQINDAKNIF